LTRTPTRITTTEEDRLSARSTDYLEEKRREFAERLKELEPLVEEYSRLEAAEAALDGRLAPTTTRHEVHRVEREGHVARAPGRGGRARGGATRAEQALELVRAHPGITIREIAHRLGIQQNYLYRVVPALAEEGVVERRGRGWHLL